MHENWGEVLVRCSRYFFLALIPFAALNFGLTRSSGISAFNLLMGGTFLVWILGHLLAWRRPQVGWIPFLLCLAILAVGGFTTAAGYPDLVETDTSDWPDWLQTVVTSYGTYDLDLSMAAMFRTVALLAGFLIAVDIFSNATWGRRLLFTLSMTALAIVAFVFVQKFTGNLLVLKSEDGKVPLSFGVYRYWGNAAAFLDLIWPITAAIAVHTGVRRTRGWSLWLAAAVLTFSALYINVSKAGHLLGVLGLALGIIVTLVYLRRTKRISSSVLSARTFLATIIPAAFLGIALFYGIQWSRWDDLEKRGGILSNERIVAYGYFLKILPDAGWLGCGPGTFQHVYPGYVALDPTMNRTPFWVAHQDYLQTIVEWGYAGTALWGLLFVPAGFFLLKRGFSLERASSRKSDYQSPFSLGEKLGAFFSAIPPPSAPLVQSGALIAILLTALHATVDFPMQIVSLQFYFLIWMALGWSKPEAKTTQD